MDIRPGTKVTGPDGNEIEIDELLGRGGFGQVFSGRMGSIRVAVKTVLTALLNDAELRALQNEARSALGIDHPNVVRMLHFDDGKSASGRPPYLVMELIDGENLRKSITAHQSAGSAFTVNELRAMYQQIAAGMEAVNAAVVHRDLKPDNVLVAGDGTLKIADFGLAKLVNAATRSETFKGWGTRAYQAPEAFEDGPNTPAMDVYAAGVMFFELATLTRPIEPRPGDPGPISWRNAHLLTPPKDIRSLRSDLPLELTQLIVQMLDKNPKKRPGSWKDVAKRATSSARTGGARDVSALVRKATSTHLANSEAETRARREQEERRERRALLQQAFTEPVGLLRELVDAFNDVSALGKLTFTATDPFSADVRNSTGHGRLMIAAHETEDTRLGDSGFARLIAIARIDPMPAADNASQAIRDRDSFGSFNLVYRVSNVAERFGDWMQFRFEAHPLTGRSTYPRWFGIGLNELPGELAALQAMGMYQHEQRALDDEWFKALLEQLL